MTFISYAQNFEDVMLWRALKHVDKGFYIDVGANDPERHSVTKAFYDRGWHGINIEPISEWHEKLQKERVNDINLKLAAGKQKGNNIMFEISGTGLSTSNLSYVKQHNLKGYESKKIEVCTETLTGICKLYVQSDIHFLKIDTEGDEKNVLQGLDLDNYRPWIILIESNLPSSDKENYKIWQKQVLTANYKLAYMDGLNHFYVAEEKSDLINSLRYPPNVFDEFTLSEHHKIQLKLHHSENIVKEANKRLDEAFAKAEIADDKIKAAEAEAFEANKRAERALAFTAPFRWMINLVEQIVRGGVAWLTFKPGCMPRRLARKGLLHLRNWVFLRPKIKEMILSVLQYMPVLRNWLKRLNHADRSFSIRWV